LQEEDFKANVELLHTQQVNWEITSTSVIPSFSEKYIPSPFCFATGGSDGIVRLWSIREISTKILWKEATSFQAYKGKPLLLLFGLLLYLMNT